MLWMVIKNVLVLQGPLKIQLVDVVLFRPVFIEQVPRKEKVFDAIITWVDRLLRRIKFIYCSSKDTAPDCATSLFDIILSCMGYQTILLVTVTPSSRQIFGQNYCDYAESRIGCLQVTIHKRTVNRK